MTDRRPWRRFAQDPAVRSDLARRVMVLLADDWDARGVAVVLLGYYARVLHTDKTNVVRALQRLAATGWLVEGDRVAGRRAVRPGPHWTGEKPSRPRDVA